MSIHELKTWPEYFRDVVSGKKRHEIRLNDRGFRVGDVLRLREWDPSSERHTGQEVLREVTYISPGGAFGLPKDLCVLSIGPFTMPPPVSIP